MNKISDVIGMFCCIAVRKGSGSNINLPYQEIRDNLVLVHAESYIRS